ncbi:hypothetical protein GCK32_011550, partial [Trichostrongylus colubriformis]
EVVSPVKMASVKDVDKPRNLKKRKLGDVEAECVAAKKVCELECVADESKSAEEEPKEKAESPVKADDAPSEESDEDIDVETVEEEPEEIANGDDAVKDQSVEGSLLEDGSDCSVQANDEKTSNNTEDSVAEPGKSDEP